MPKKYTSEQFWKLRKGLSEELKTALSSDETGDNIYSVCEKYNVLEHLDEIVESVGAVLLGLLPPDQFQETLEKELEIEKDIAKKIAQEIYRFILYPVKGSLERLYKIDIAPLAKMKIISPSSPLGKPHPPSKDDTYREPIE